PRLPFLVAAAVAGINAVAALRRLPETNPGHRAADHHERWVAQTGLEDDVVVVVEPGATTARPGLPLLLAVAFISLVAYSAFEMTFPFFGAKRLGFHQVSVGAVFAAVGLVLVAVQASLVHPVVRRLGEAGTLRLGLAVNAAGLLLLAAVHSWWMLVPALAALVVGQGLAMPALTAAFAG